MRLPDYDRSSLSVTASVKGHFGAQSMYPRLPEIDRQLAAGGINKIVLLLADGYGEYLLRRHLPADAFTLTHDVCAVSAVFPSTTTAATTSIWTGVSPLEHGWMGWSLYFKESAAQIDAFTGCESHRGERMPDGSPASKLMPLPDVNAGIADAELHMIFPFDTSAMSSCAHKHVVRELDDMLSLARALCAEEGRKLVYIYTNEPDHTMHETGVNSAQTKANFLRIDESVRRFAGTLSDDALLVLTADHGLVDATEPVIINEIPEIDECLWMPPSIEARAAAFFVKPFRRAQFERAFKERCGGDFVLFTREEALDMHLFGRGAMHRKTEDFIGDYIACATGGRFIRYDTISGRVPHMIGMHAGLTDEEMTVPVVIARGEGRR
ncbi:MAG: alkaline phosphatase family protein [Clostridia bacterium]|nr:alkaline phosphatase family protein [Clostridia bacterium]